VNLLFAPLKTFPDSGSQSRYRNYPQKHVRIVYGTASDWKYVTDNVIVYRDSFILLQNEIVGRLARRHSTAVVLFYHVVA
jgi:hypothetical protein